jgi:hypothetical protein
LQSVGSQIPRHKRLAGNFFVPSRAVSRTRPIWRGSVTTNGMRTCAGRKRWAKSSIRRLLYGRQFAEIARLATSIESRTNLLFSFEKMALRDAVRSPAGAKAFANALFDLLYGSDPLDVRFDRWIAAAEGLSRRQTRVLTWPLRVRLYRSAKDALLLQADGNARGGTPARRRTAVCIPAVVATLSQPADIGPESPERYQRHAAARHDRHAVVSLGPGFG